MSIWDHVPKLIVKRPKRVRLTRDKLTGKWSWGEGTESVTYLTKPVPPGGNRAGARSKLTTPAPRRSASQVYRARRRARAAKQARKRNRGVRRR